VVSGGSTQQKGKGHSLTAPGPSAEAIQAPRRPSGPPRAVLIPPSCAKHPGGPGVLAHAGAAEDGDQGHSGRTDGRLTDVRLPARWGHGQGLEEVVEAAPWVIRGEERPATFVGPEPAHDG